VADENSVKKWGIQLTLYSAGFLCSRKACHEDDYIH